MTRSAFGLQRRQLLGLAASAFSLPAFAQSAAFDHSHVAWTHLLEKHLVLLDSGKASQLRYAGMAADRAALKAYLAQLSAVTPAAFDAFSKPQQMAFLINAYNAYNAFTVELILTRYPKLESIRDLGSLLTKPWSIRNVPLLGTTLTLDNIEHDTLRAKGRYADGKLELSKIFDWYGGDFKFGHKGITSLPAFFARYAAQLADAPADRERIKAQGVAMGFLDYDWKLNDAK